MITQIQLVRGIGQFADIQGTRETTLDRLSLIYAENGRGKTTLTAILRSLASRTVARFLNGNALGKIRLPKLYFVVRGSSVCFRR